MILLDYKVKLGKNKWSKHTFYRLIFTFCFNLQQAFAEHDGIADHTGTHYHASFGQAGNMRAVQNGDFFISAFKEKACKRSFGF